MSGLGAVLTYHSLERSRSVISLDPGRFRRQMETLAARDISVVGLRELIGSPATSGTRTATAATEVKAAPAAALTFDDGFADFRSRAFPVLAERGFAATVFIVTGYCGGTNDWPSQPRGLGGRRMLSWAAVSELSEAGIEFGAHTVTHPDLRRLTRAEAREEVLGSKKMIEDRTGRAVEAFAYPYGYESEELCDLVGEHFAVGCSTRMGYVEAASPAASIERIDIHYLRSRFWFDRLFQPAGRVYVGCRATLRKLGKGRSRAG